MLNKELIIKAIMNDFNNNDYVKFIKENKIFNFEVIFKGKIKLIINDDVFGVDFESDVDFFNKLNETARFYFKKLIIIIKFYNNDIINL